MKAIKILVFAMFVGMSFLISCKKDSGSVGPGIGLENCDDTDCNDKSCALSVKLITDIICSISDESDIDWYAVTVSQPFVDSNHGIYSLYFDNFSDNTTLKLGLFEDGVSSGNVSVQGGHDSKYEPKEASLSGLQFSEAGTYYISVESISGKDSNGAIYEIRID